MDQLSDVIDLVTGVLRGTWDEVETPGAVNTLRVLLDREAE